MNDPLHPEERSADDLYADSDVYSLLNTYRLVDDLPALTDERIKEAATQLQVHRRVDEHNVSHQLLLVDECFPANRRPPRARRRKPNLKNLTRFADFFGLGLRKRLKAMAGDFDAEISRLHKQHRYVAAKWNKCLAWSYAIWYVLRGPLDWARAALVKALTGN